MRRSLVLFLLCAGVLLVPAGARADATAFVGVSPTGVTHPVRGFAAGAGLLILGFEFEYARTSENVRELVPQLQTYMGNGLLQTPFPIAGLQFYATAGAGAYRETLLDVTRTNVGVNVGGGVKVSLLGPLRLRFDYRVFTLRGEPRHPRPQRFYAGINLRF